MGESDIQGNAPVTLQESNIAINIAVIDTIKNLPSLINKFIEENNITERYKIETMANIEKYRIDSSSSLQKSNNRSFLIYSSISIIALFFFYIKQIDLTAILIFITMGYSYFLSINKNILDAINKITQSIKKSTD